MTADEYEIAQAKVIMRNASDWFDYATGNDMVETKLFFGLFTISRHRRDPVWLCMNKPSIDEVKWAEQVLEKETSCPSATLDRIKKATEIAIRWGQIDGDHHKAWVIDQMVRALNGPDYDRIIEESKAGEDGPDTYGWDVGIAP